MSIRATTTTEVTASVAFDVRSATHHTSTSTHIYIHTHTMTVTPVFEIYGAAQSYDWGTLGRDGSKVAQFSKAIPGFEYSESKPYAEVRSRALPVFAVSVSVC